MQLQEEINKAFTNMMAILSSMDDEAINTIPFEGSWTAGQVVEHILKSVGNLPAFFNENIEPAGRRIDEMEEDIKKIFLDFSIKMKTPDFIQPSSGLRYNKDELINTLNLLQSQTLEAAATHDLSVLCKSFEFPGWGFLTKYEWLVFIVCHVKRHTFQLENIRKSFLLKHSQY